MQVSTGNLRETGQGYVLHLANYQFLSPPTQWVELRMGVGHLHTVPFPSVITLRFGGEEKFKRFETKLKICDTNLLEETRRTERGECACPEKEVQTAE